MGNDISGLADPDYLPAGGRAGAAVVITHIRLAPRVADPEPALRRRGGRRGPLPRPSAPTGARAAGVPAERIVLDAGLDLGKTAEQSLALLRASSTPGRARLPAAALGVEQDLPRQDPRSGAHRAA